MDMVCWPSWATDNMICYKKKQWCWQALYLSVSLFLIKTRPGVLKDLKTMGSVSLFIFFVTLLVLARQVSVRFVSQIIPGLQHLVKTFICKLHLFKCAIFLNTLSRVEPQFGIEELAFFLTENKVSSLNVQSKVSTLKQQQLYCLSWYSVCWWNVMTYSVILYFTVFHCNISYI